MKAREMAQRINLAENKITKKISHVIHEELRHLVTDTGLEVSGVSIDLIDITAIESRDREYHVSTTSICCRLPRPIG